MAAKAAEPVLTEEQLSKEFREYSVAEFFKRNRQMLGYSSKVRSLTTIVHEYVTNSLDACEEAGILPDIYVEIQSISARPRDEELGTADGANKAFLIPDEIYDADMLDILSGGFQQGLKRDYDFKTEKKGKEAVRYVVFKTPPAPGAKVVARWAHGHLKVITEDNGTGIPKKNVGQALGKLLAGTKFHQRKQKRGQQGIGASYAVLFSQITTGKPTHVKSGIGDGRVYECDISIDVKTNEAVIRNERDYAGKFRGVRVESEFAEVTYNRSEYSVYEYLRRTALANPHAQITLVEPNKEIVVFPRASKEIPAKPFPVLPHPLGVTVSDLMDMASSSKSRKIASFLSTEFASFSSDKVKELQQMHPDINLERAPSALQWHEAEKIVQSIQKMKFIKSLDEGAIVPIGEEQIEKSLKNLLQPEKLRVNERKPKFFRGGIPFLVEAAIAYGGKAGAGYEERTAQGGEAVQTGSAKLEVLRYANRTPLLFDEGTCAIAQAVKEIDWNRYDLKDLDNQPVSIFVNFVSVYVPYTGAGKLAISAEEDIVTEIKLALQECARDVSVYLHSLARAADQEARRKIFFNYIGEVAQALHDLTGRPKTELEAKLRVIAEARTALLEAQDAEEAGLEQVEEAAEEEIEEEGENPEKE